MDEMGNLDDDLQAEFATAKHSGNFAVLILGPAIDFIGDQDRATILQPPHGPRMRKLTFMVRDAFGKHLFGSLGQFELIPRADAAASHLWFPLGFHPLATRFLSFL